MKVNALMIVRHPCGQHVIVYEHIQIKEGIVTVRHHCLSSFWVNVIYVFFNSSDVN
jgi:hypothetical protein